MNIVPCLKWVKRGVAERVPHKIELDKDELKKLIESTRDDLDEFEDQNDSGDENEDQGAAAVKQKEDNKSENSNKKKKAKKRKHDETDENEADDDIVSKYGLDDYDGEGDDEEAIVGGMGALSFYASNEDDPYVTAAKDETVDSDEEDYEIQPTDNLVLVGRTQKEHCFLEVYVYNEDHGNLFVHHDYLLPSFPLAVEWLNFNPTDSSTGSYVAVATMEPVIEIWNLDIIDCLEPAAVLGRKMSKKKKKKKQGSSQGHTDSVLDLSWNSLAGNVLASASADHTIGVWDLVQQSVATSIRTHKDKVQCVQWHPQEAQTLLSGSFDQSACVYDCRSSEENHKSWKIEGEVERVLWNTYSPVIFFATTDKGSVHYIDIRQDSKPVFTLSAHSEAVTGISLSSSIPGLFVTTSSDKTMKVWDVDGGKPSLVLERNLKLNELYCVDNCPDAPFVFAFGGEKTIKVWDIRESAAVRKHFHSRMSSALQAECEGDDKDLPGDTEEPAAMETVPMDDNSEDEKEVVQEMTVAAGQKKKKKKRKKKKKVVTEN